MLTLTRKPGERLIFTLPDGRESSIEVRRCHGNIRLNCDFPADVRIRREEVPPKPNRPNC